MAKMTPEERAQHVAGVQEALKHAQDDIAMKEAEDEQKAREREAGIQREIEEKTGVKKSCQAEEAAQKAKRQSKEMESKSWRVKEETGENTQEQRVAARAHTITPATTTCGAPSRAYRADDTLTILTDAARKNGKVSVADLIQPLMPFLRSSGANWPFNVVAASERVLHLNTLLALQEATLECNEVFVLEPRENGCLDDTGENGITWKRMPAHPSTVVQQLARVAFANFNKFPLRGDNLLQALQIEERERLRFTQMAAVAIAEISQRTTSFVGTRLRNFLGLQSNSVG